MDLAVHGNFGMGIILVTRSLEAPKVTTHSVEDETTNDGEETRGAYFVA